MLKTPASPTLRFPCLVCLGDTVLLTNTLRDELGQAYSLRACKHCGSAFLWPPPSAEALSIAYSSAYYGAGESKFGGPIEQFRRLCARTETSRIRRLAPAATRVLDVGCGSGEFLVQLSKTGFTDCHGLELPGPAADRAERHPAIQIHRTDLAHHSFSPSSFDVVSARHVFEHLAHPGASFAQLATLLRPGGLLYLAIPNRASLQARCFPNAWFHWDPPRHLNFTTREGFIHLAAENQMELVREYHWNWEQNLYGWPQSLLNSLSAKRNLLYNFLKAGNRAASPRGEIVLHGILATATLPAAFLLEVVANSLGHGATTSYLFRKATNHV